MEYSLYDLNKVTDLKNLKIETLINRLNLIGLEVDNVMTKNIDLNSSLTDQILTIAIPANREDLLTEKLFVQELQSIFKIKPFSYWNITKQTYKPIINNVKSQYQNYSKHIIDSNLENVLTYIIEVEKYKKIKTPTWLELKLLKFNIKSKNILEDIINLVILEWGQNVNILNGENNNFKLIKLPEPFLYTDKTNQSYNLEEGTVVLTNSNLEILSVLGLFKIQSSNTNACFLELTFYDIHENPLNLKTINTQLSYRYLRKNFLSHAKKTFQRVLSLIELLCYAKIKPIIYHNKVQQTEIKKPQILTLTKKSAKQFLNISEYNSTVFIQAGLKIICETSQTFYFEIPTTRADLNRSVDLIEEYSRFIGYANFQELIPVKQITYSTQNNNSIDFTKQFFLNYGFNEIVTNSIYDVEKSIKQSVKIKNPLNKELAVLRTSLIPNLLTTFEENLKSNNNNQQFFEIGRTFKIFEQKIIEQEKLGGIFNFRITGKNLNADTHWFFVKGFLQNYLEHYMYKNLTFTSINKTLTYYNPTRSTIIKDNDLVLGSFGELNPLIKINNDSKETIYVFELNLNLLPSWRLNTEIKSFKPFSKFPSIKKDISLQFPSDTNFIKLRQFITLNLLALKNMEFFDVYFEEKNRKQKVNIGIALEFQSEKETLTTEFIEQQIQSLTLKLQQNFN